MKTVYPVFWITKSDLHKSNFPACEQELWVYIWIQKDKYIYKITLSFTLLLILLFACQNWLSDVFLCSLIVLQSWSFGPLLFKLVRIILVYLSEQQKCLQEEFHFIFVNQSASPSGFIGSFYCFLSRLFEVNCPGTKTF